MRENGVPLDEEADDEGEGGIPEEDVPEGVVERVGLPKEDQWVRKLKDPKLPSQEDIERHWLMGHMPFRSWCEVCLESKAKELGHRRDVGGDRDVPGSIILITVSQEMRWGLSGRC